MTHSKSQPSIIRTLRFVSNLMIGTVSIMRSNFPIRIQKLANVICMCQVLSRSCWHDVSGYVIELSGVKPGTNTICRHWVMRCRGWIPPENSFCLLTNNSCFVSVILSHKKNLQITLGFQKSQNSEVACKKRFDNKQTIYTLKKLLIPLFKGRL